MKKQYVPPKKKFVMCTLIHSVRILLFSTFSFSMCKVGFSQHNANTLEKIIARINEDVIQLSEHEKFTRDVNFLRSINGNSALSPQQSLPIMVSNLLMKQLLKKNDIVIDERLLQLNIKAFIRSIAPNIEHSDNVAIMKVLRSQGIADLNFLRYQTKYQIIRARCIQFLLNNHKVPKPSLEEMSEHYKKNVETYQIQRKVKLAHIVLWISNTDALDPTIIEKKEQLITFILERLTARTESFQTLAQKYSEDKKTKFQGGLLGWQDYDTLSKISVEYAKKAFQLKPGGFFGPIWSKSGIHVIKTINQIPRRQLSFEEAKPFVEKSIREKTAQQVLLAWLENYKKISVIHMYNTPIIP